jgi:hypothetical protein
MINDNTRTIRTLPHSARVQISFLLNVNYPAMPGGEQPLPERNECEFQFAPVDREKTRQRGKLIF